MNLKNTILLVDDDPSRMTSLVDFIKLSSFNVIVETDASRVIPRFTQKQNEIGANHSRYDDAFRSKV